MKTGSNGLDADFWHLVVVQKVSKSSYSIGTSAWLLARLILKLSERIQTSPLETTLSGILERITQQKRRIKVWIGYGLGTLDRQIELGGTYPRQMSKPALAGCGLGAVNREKCSQFAFIPLYRPFQCIQNHSPACDRHAQHVRVRCSGKRAKPVPYA